MKTAMLILSLFIYCCNSHAVKINFSATLTSINCVINNDKPADVDFGDAVGVNHVDGVRYQQRVPISIVCRTPPGKQLELAFLGITSNFDASALFTGIDDLGIRIMQNNQPIIINQRFTLDDLTQPIFYAVPIKRAGSALKSGRFKALATLVIKYE